MSDHSLAYGMSLNVDYLLLLHNLDLFDTACR